MCESGKKLLSGEKIADGSCSPCEQGHFINESSHYKKNCDKCQAGYYQDELGQETCKTSPKGNYVELEASSSYQACSKGHYAFREAMNICLPCYPGSYQHEEGQDFCIEAGADKFVIDSTLESISCPSGSSTLEKTDSDSASYCFANPGYKGKIRDLNEDPFYQITINDEIKTELEKAPCPTHSSGNVVDGCSLEDGYIGTISPSIIDPFIK